MATTATRASPRARARQGTSQPPVRRPTVWVVLVAVLALLNLIGLVMVLSASSVNALHEYGSSFYYFDRQLLWTGLGAVGLVIAARVDYHRWQKLGLPLVVLCCFLLVLVLIPGVGINVNGSSRWLGYGPVQMQPSELAKLAMLLWSADLLSRRAAWMADTRVTMRPVLAVLALVSLLLLKQPNLGTTIVLGAIVFAVLFVAGAPLAPLAGWLSFCTVVALGLSLGEGYRRARVLAFLNPWKDPLNNGYQIIQARTALASGGPFGLGLGESRAKWGFLPFAHTDFIFAIIGEELGMVGASLVVLLFVLLGYLGVRASMRAPDRFGQLVAAGITAWFAVQAFVNIGAVIGVLPITGVPLPFISAGGSSLLVSMAAAGILLNVAAPASQG